MHVPTAVGVTALALAADEGGVGIAGFAPAPPNCGEVAATGGLVADGANFALSEGCDIWPLLRKGFLVADMAILDGHGGHEGYW